MNGIPNEQNTKASLDWLAAQRQSYTDAKRVAVLQAGLLLSLPIVSAISVALDPELRVWAAFAGLGFALVDASVLDPWQRRLRDKGAATQEIFDCHVLGLDWNIWIGGSQPDPENVHGAAARFDASRPAGRKALRNWYPPRVGDLPLHLGRVICQRASCRWDSQLRRYYARGIAVLVAVVGAGVFALGLAAKMTLEHLLLAVLAPLTPAFLWAIREGLRQREAARSGDSLKERGMALWGKAVKAEVDEARCESLSRQFQDAIFLHRRRSPFVFDWFYRVFRKQFEAQMHASTEQMIAEATQGRLPNC